MSIFTKEFLQPECPFKVDDRVCHIHGEYVRGVVKEIRKISPMSLNIGGFQGFTWNISILEDGQKIMSEFDFRHLRLV